MRRARFLAAVMLLVIAAGGTGRAWGQSAAPPAITEEERAEQQAKEGKDLFPLGASIALTQLVGGGSFTADPDTRRSAVTTALTLAPYLRITDFMRLNTRLDIIHSVVENYDSVATYRNRTMLSDAAFELAHLKLWVVPVVGVKVSGGLGGAFPTSPQSRFRDLVFAGVGRLSLSKAAGPFLFMYTFSPWKNFNRYTSPTVNPDDVGDNVVLPHFEGNERVGGGLISVGGNNESWGVLNALLATWNITDEWAFSLYFEAKNSWTYDTASQELDENSSPYATEGPGQRDVIRGVVDLTYTIDEHLSAALGTDTVVPPFSANNEDFVFPFANFSNDYRSSTSIYLALTGVY